MYIYAYTELHTYLTWEDLLKDNNFFLLTSKKEIPDTSSALPSYLAIIPYRNMHTYIHLFTYMYVCIAHATVH